MAAMTEEPIKFRCYKCNKLLGVPARKVGSIVSCPQCQAELQVPRLETAVEPSAPSAAPEIAVEPSPSAPPSSPAVTIPTDFPTEPSGSGPAVDDALLVAIQVEPPSIRRAPTRPSPVSKTSCSRRSLFWPGRCWSSWPSPWPSSPAS